MKKFFLVVLIVCIGTVAFAQRFGDANQDGKVSIIDALAVAQHYVGITKIPINRDLADVNSDGAITIVDALMIARYYVDLITSFPTTTPTATPTPTPEPPPTETPEPTATPTPAPAGFAVSLRSISVDDDEKFTTEINLEAPGYRVSNFNIYINYDSQLIIPDPAAGIQMVGMTFGDYYISRGGNYINIDYSNVIQGSASGTLMTIHWLSLSDVNGSCDIEIKVNRIGDMDGNSLQSTTANGRCTVTRTNYVGMRWENQSNNQALMGDSAVSSFIYFDTGNQEATDFEFRINYNTNHLALNEAVGEMGVEVISSGIDLSVNLLSSGTIAVSGDNFSGISSGNVLKINWKTLPSVSGSGTISVSSINLRDSGSMMETQGVNASYTLESATATPEITETPEPTLTPTPVIKPANFNVDLELPSPARWGGTITHWIPNNREAMEPFRIKVSAQNDIGDGSYFGSFDFTDTYQAVNILTPVDAAYDNSESGNSNIHMNRGTAPIEIMACNQSGSNLELLNRFELSGDDSTQYRYRQTTTNIGQNLKVDSEGYLYFDTGFNELQYFTVQLGNGGTARPGDDILLRFELLNYPQQSDTVSEGDFLAVYDKNLLDAANQFIDQTINEDGTATGVVDWNGTSQIDIQHWRRFSDGNLVQNAVAYGWGCYDDVNQFNSEVTALNGLSQDVNNWYDYTFPPFTTREEGGINYYVPVDPQHSVPGLTTYARFGDESQAMKVFKDKDGIALDADGGILDSDNADQKNYSWRLCSVSSGDDCSGFVSRSTFLSGTNYKIVDIDENLSEEKEGTSILADTAASWAIGSADRNLIVPGDILVRANDHVAFVFYINFDENSRILEDANLNKVRIIHSTGLNLLWRVRNDNFWSQIGGQFLPRRLII
ncbi:MAG: dockerin type I repeat-containing protein, partial [Spirochaetales bacterium]|nr:dockerin type I repeat-containing protein [Spirochaetales bacterium]